MYRTVTIRLAAHRLGGAFRSLMRKPRSRRSTGVLFSLSDQQRYCFSDAAEHRNEGGQILFVEFCDWAIKKQLCTQECGSVPAKVGEAGHVLSASPGAVTPSAAARSTRPRSAVRDRPTRATPLAVSKSQESGGIIEKHSDYRCVFVF